MSSATAWMRQHKVLTGVGAFIAIGTVGSLADADTKGPDEATNKPQDFASVPNAAPTSERLEVVPTEAATALSAPSTSPVKPTSTAAPAPTKAVIVTAPSPSPKAAVTAAPKPAATTAPKPTPKPVATQPPAPAAKEYANCTELNADYPHGVGRPGAKDQTSTGNPVTNFKVDQALYDANTKSDRDDDGIACEKH